MSLQILQANIAIMQSMLVDGAIIYRRERDSGNEWEQRDTVPDQPNFYRYEYKVELPSDAPSFTSDDLQHMVSLRNRLNSAINNESISEVEAVASALSVFVTGFQSR